MVYKNSHLFTQFLICFLCINCHRETKVDTDNPYYHDLNENWVEKYHGEDITAEKIGGLECGKCHY